MQILNIRRSRKKRAPVVAMLLTAATLLLLTCACRAGSTRAASQAALPLPSAHGDAVALRAGTNVTFTTTERIDELRKQLKAPTYGDRQHAEQLLVQCGVRILPDLLSHLSDPDPEIRHRVQRIVTTLAPKLSADAVRNLTIVFDEERAVQEGADALAHLFAVDGLSLERALAFADRRPARLRAVAFTNMCNAVDLEARNRSAQLVCKLYGDSLSEDDRLLTLSATNNWIELCAHRRALLHVKRVIESDRSSQEKTALVRHVRFSRNVNLQDIGPTLANCLPNTTHRLGSEIIRTLNAMDYWPNAVNSEVIKRPNGLSGDGFAGVPFRAIPDLVSALELAAEDVRKRARMALIRQIGLFGPPGAKYLSVLTKLIDDLEPDQKRIHYSRKALAQIGSASIPYIEKKLGQGENFARAVTWMAKEEYARDKTACVRINRLLFSTTPPQERGARLRFLLNVNVEDVSYLPHMDKCIPEMEALLPTLAPNHAARIRAIIGVAGERCEEQGQAILEMMRGYDPQHDLGGHQAADTMRSLLFLGTHDSEAMAWSRVFLQQAILKGGQRQKAAYPVIRQLGECGEEAIVVLPELLQFASMHPTNAPGGRLGNNTIFIWQAISELAPYSKDALLRILEIKDSQLYIRRNLLYHVANKGHCLQNDVEPLIQAYVADFDLGSRRAVYGARGLRALGPMARAAIPRLKELAESDRPAVAIIARSLLVSLDDTDDRHIDALAHQFACMTDVARSPYSTSAVIEPIGALGAAAKPMVPALLSLCSDPRADDAVRGKALDAVYRIAPADERVSAVMLDCFRHPFRYFDCPRDWQYERLAERIADTGIQSPEMRSGLRKIASTFALPRVRTSLRRALRNCAAVAGDPG